MTDITVRQAGLSDLPAVTKIMQAAFDARYGEAWTARQCEGVLSLPGAQLWLAETGDDICGFALIRTILDEAELLLIAVDPDTQRRGIGRTLLSAVTESAATNGIKFIHLEVRQGNPAVHLYETVGFVQVGRRAQYYSGADGQFFDAQTYRLNFV